jgi:hypothetical protein
LPYPFAPAPHISEFREILERDFGCEFKREKLVFGEGLSFEFTYIERDMGGGEILTYPFYEYEEDMLVHPLLLKSICRTLRLDCSCFGLTLEDLEDFD